MAGQFLSANDRALMQALIQADHVSSRRAQVILAYDDGLQTRVIAEQVGYSARQVRRIRLQFERMGSKIFPKARVHEDDLRLDSTPFEDQLQKQTNTPAETHQPEAEYSGKEPRGKSKRSSQVPKQKSSLIEKSETDIPFPSQLASIGINPGDSMAEAGRKTLLFHFAEMLRHEEGTCIGEDVEELHDMRVATRRMRAAFEVFADAFNPKVIKIHMKGLRKTGRYLGRVRDLDVLIDKAHQYMQTLPENQSNGLAPLLKSWEDERADGRKQMLEWLVSPMYLEFKQKFNVFLQTPGAGLSKQASSSKPEPNLVCEIAPVLIYMRLASVRAFDAILETATVEQLHLLRIEFKKLRYTFEYLREVLGADIKLVIDEIKKIQDHLGDLNDARVAVQLLNDFQQNWESQQKNLPLAERQNLEPIVTYQAERYAELHRLLVTFPKVWHHFNRSELRAGIARAVSSL